MLPMPLERICAVAPMVFVAWASARQIRVYSHSAQKRVVGVRSENEGSQYRTALRCDSSRGQRG